MAWYCKECGDWFVFGYSKKYCSEDCYDERQERKERKQAKKQAKRRKREILSKEISILKSSFHKKWDINYNSSDTSSQIINIEDKLSKIRQEILLLNKLKNSLK